MNTEGKGKKSEILFPNSFREKYPQIYQFYLKNFTPRIKMWIMMPDLEFFITYLAHIKFFYKINTVSE